MQGIMRVSQANNTVHEHVRFEARHVCQGRAWGIGDRETSSFLKSACDFRAIYNDRIMPDTGKLEY